MTTISLRLSEHRPLTTELSVSAQTMWTRLLKWIQTTLCVINGGHYKVLHTAPDRMSLRCVACGHKSPGWEVGSPRSRAPSRRIRSACVRAARRLA